MSELTPAEREALRAAMNKCRPPIVNEIDAKIFRAGFRAAREYSKQREGGVGAVSYESLREALVAVERRERKLRGALWKFGSHEHNCSMVIDKTRGLALRQPCDCGFEAALAENGDSDE